MGRKEKLLARLQSNPKDFTFEEAETLLSYFDYRRSNKGKTSGSRVMFTSREHQAKILLHRPHPGNELSKYQVRQLREHIEREGLV